MSLRGIQLLARFSLPPNRLRLCGGEEITAELIDCVTLGESDLVLRSIPGFKSQLPYLKTIAEVTERDYLDYEVVEAYWLGNDLLTQFQPEDYQIFLKYLPQLDLPEIFTHSMQKRKPTFFIPFHLYSVTASVPNPISKPIQEQVDQCRISWGEVTDKTISAISYYPECDPDIRAGDMAAFHWNMVVEILTRKEHQNLMFWTNKVQALANAGE